MGRGGCQWPVGGHDVSLFRMRRTENDAMGLPANVAERQNRRGSGYSRGFPARASLARSISPSLGSSSA